MNKDAKETNIARARCNRCRIVTNHDVLFTKTVLDYVVDEDDPEWRGHSWNLYYQMLQCRGCESVTMLYDQSDAPWADPEHPVYAREYYPPRESRHMPDWARGVLYTPDNEPWTGLLEEVYRAMATGSRRIAMMGIRALLDVVIQKTVGDQGTFKEGLKALGDRGYASQKNVVHLDAVIQAGHASAHRGFNPTSKQVAQAMDIVENILHSAFILDSVSKELVENTPKRHRPPKKNATKKKSQKK